MKALIMQLNPVNILRSICSHIMHVDQDSLNAIESAESVFNQYLLGRNNMNGHESFNGGLLKNSISRFENPKFGQIRILVPS